MKEKSEQENLRVTFLGNRTWTRFSSPLLLVAMISGLLIFVSSTLVFAEINATALTVSKSVSTATPLIEDAFRYTIEVAAADDGGDPNTFQLTDTIPADLTYVAGSAESSTGFVSISVDSGVLTTTAYAINASEVITVSFLVTASTSTVTGTVVTNTVYLGDIGNSLVLSDSVEATLITATVVSTYYIQLPITLTPLPAPTLSSITDPSGSVNEWTVSWLDAHSGVSDASGYELQEATDANFTENVTTTDLGLVTSTTVAKSLSTTSAVYHYRIRLKTSAAVNNKSLWSNTSTVTSLYSYEDTFSDAGNPTNWRIVRQDTDTVVNKVSISDTSPGYLDLRMESGHDYMIASDLSKVPDGAYTLVARMRMEDADPRHAGGIIIGGDYDGSSNCPVSDTDYSSCFTQYYRFMFVAGNLGDQIDIQIKRIESHSDSNNSGGGTTLASSTVTGTNRDAWIEWTIAVGTDGTMVLKMNGTTVHTVVDTTYQNNKYFGFWSSTSDTSFSNTQIDWVTITAN